MSNDPNEPPPGITLLYPFLKCERGDWSRFKELEIVERKSTFA
jgi:hypothetical protein